MQIQQFGKKGEEFLESWGVKPLTPECIQEFKADVTNWPYLQAGYYVGLTKIVEYMDVQANGVSSTFGAYETIRQISQNLGITCSQVARQMGAISDTMFISVRSISFIVCISRCTYNSHICTLYIVY